MFDFTIGMYGLCFKCPFYDQKWNCHLKFLRCIEDIKDQIEVVDSMEENLKRQIYSKHIECLKERESTNYMKSKVVN